MLHMYYVHICGDMCSVCVCACVVAMARERGDWPKSHTGHTNVKCAAAKAATAAAAQLQPNDNTRRGTRIAFAFYISAVCFVF